MAFFPIERNRLAALRSPQNGATPQLTRDESSVKLALHALHDLNRSTTLSILSATLCVFVPLRSGYCIEPACGCVFCADAQECCTIPES
jgi:hypothetical protein